VNNVTGTDANKLIIGKVKTYLILHFRNYKETNNFSSKTVYRIIKADRISDCRCSLIKKYQFL